MVLVVFALPEESREFRRAIRAVREPWSGWRGDIAPSWRGNCADLAVRVAHCGVGPVAAAHAAERLLAEDLPDFVVIAGFAGALAPHLATGDVVLGESVSDPALLQHMLKIGFAASPYVFVGALVSVPLPVETVAAKAALAAQGGLAVDMETAEFSRACRAAGVPVVAVRAISDRADEPLPVPFAVWFDIARQRPRVLALLAFLLVHPRRIPAFARFVRGLRPARRRLSLFLRVWLNAKGMEQWRRHP